jgi:putative phage-type endonuclease
MIEHTPTQRELWLAERRLGLGGSDAAAALGWSPWKTPLKLYLEKRGEIAEEDISGKPVVEWGCRLEDVIADAYAEKMGVKVARVNSILRHPKYPFIGASLDRRVVGVPRGLEVKTTSFMAGRDEEKWGETGTDQVPIQYRFQCQHYMAVTGYAEFHLAVLVGGNDFRIYIIPRNDIMIDAMIDLEVEFWRGVQNGIPPTSKTIADVRMKFGAHVGGSVIEADAAAQGYVEEYLALAGMLKEAKKLEDRRDDLQTLIGEYMGTNETLAVGGVPRISFKAQSTGKRLPASFRESEPAIFEQYAVEGTTRVMRILAEKKKKP